MGTNESIPSPFSSYPVQGFKEHEAPDITAWKLSRSAIEHENHLVNHRLTWFFSTQAFLLGGFFLVLSNFDKAKVLELAIVKDIPIVFIAIGILAIYMCLATRHGILRASHAIKDVTEHYEKLNVQLEFSRTPPLHLSRNPNIFSSSNIPLVTAIMWVFLEIFCAVSRIPSVNEFLNGLDQGKVMLAAGLFAAMSGACIIAYSLGVNRRLTRPR